MSKSACVALKGGIGVLQLHAVYTTVFVLSILALNCAHGLRIPSRDNAIFFRMGDRDRSSLGRR